MANDFTKIEKGLTLGALASDPSGGLNGDIYYNTTTNKFRKYENGAWKNLSDGGSGQGSKNYIANGTFEDDISGVATYDDGANYVDGTGGSPTAITISRTTSSPLAGTASLLISKAASSSVGEGASILSTTIDIEDRTRPLFVKLSYDFSHANYVSGDVQLKAYDMTNGAILAVRPLGNLDTSGGFLKTQAIATAMIYQPSTCTQVRLSIHCQTDNASGSAWTAKVDSVSVGPDSPTPTAVQTDWISYTPTLTGSSSNPTVGAGSINGKYRRVGDSVECMIGVTFGSGMSAGSGTYLFSLPTGFTIDSTKINLNGNAQTLGNIWLYDDSGNQYTGTVIANASDYTKVRVSVSTGILTNAFPVTWAANDSFTMRFTVPCVGLSAGNVMSTFEVALQTAGVYARSSSTASQANGSWVTVGSWTKERDTANEFDATTGVYTAAKSGWRIFFGGIGWASNTTGQRLAAFWYQDTSIRLGQEQRANLNSGSVNTTIGGVPYYLNQGETIRLKGFQDSGGALALGGNPEQQVFAVISIPDFSAFGAYSNVGEVVDGVSSTKTPGASGQYAAMTGNGLSLTPGRWMLTGTVSYGSSGSAGISYMENRWVGANGADNGTVPAAISTLAGATVLTNTVSTYQPSASGALATWPAATTIIELTQPQTIYLVPYQTSGTAANVRLTTRQTATRLR